MTTKRRFMDTRSLTAILFGATLLVAPARPAFGLVERFSADPHQTSADCTLRPDPSFDDKAHQVVCLINASRFSDVRAQFDATMLEALPEDQLATAWRTYLDTFGDFEAAGAPTSMMLGNYTVEQVPVRLSRSEGEIRVTFNPDGTIAGLFFLRPGVPVQ